MSLVKYELDFYITEDSVLHAEGILVAHYKQNLGENN
jgi:hypothetical protein